MMALSVEELGQAVASEASHRLIESQNKIRHCLNQLTDEQVRWRQAESQNSIGNIILHLCGNVRQWIVSGIGGEPDLRDRPKEFSERRGLPKDELLRQLDEVVHQACATLSSTPVAELLVKRRVQGFDVTALAAIFDSVPHFVGHTHQIVYIARSLLGDAYQFEWTP
ncbi:MAG: DUF1572 family protein [Thermoguttaceae bacterium]